MPTVAVPHTRFRVGRSWLTLEALYVAVVTIVAVVAMSAEHRRPLLLVATALTLPCGLIAFVGLYVLTAFFNLAASGFSSSVTEHASGGCSPNGHCWSHTTGTPVGARGFLFSASVVVLFTAASLGNVLLLRLVVRRRRVARSPANG